MSSSESAPPPKSNSSSRKAAASPPPPPPPAAQSAKSPPPPAAQSAQSPPPPAAQSTPIPEDGATATPVLTPPAAPGVAARAPPPPARAAKKSTPTVGEKSGYEDLDTRILIGVLAGTGLLILFIVSLVCCACCCRKKKKKLYPGDHDQMQYYGNGKPNGVQAYNDGPSHKQWHNPEHALQMPPHHGGAWGPQSASHGYLSSDMSSNLSSPQSLVPGMMLPQPPPPLGGFNKNAFTYEELAAATSGFSHGNLLGQGGFGFVHKGVLQNGKEVAVKSLKSGSGQGEREFQAEVEIISRVHHRHLVSLVGYCIAGQQRMLVYEFVPNNNLEFHLHGKGRPPMEWGMRLKIAKGSAKGLAYLHEDCHPRIIHRDIKTANILIDNNFDAKVADFGLAKLSSDNNTHVSTRIMGTFGYLAPEYASSGKLTEKSDVYSFGVMLLELITGQLPVDYTGEMDESLVEWARPLLQFALEDENYDEFVDPRLEKNFDAHEMRRMVACAAASIRHSARRRPKMSQIVRALEGDVSLDDLNERVKPGQSGMFKSDSSSGSSYTAELRKFRKMALEDSPEYVSSEFGATSEYGLNPSSSSSDSTESGQVVNQKPISSSSS